MKLETHIQRLPHPPARCLARTNTTPLTNPILIDSKLGSENDDSYKIKPTKLTGILLRLPTRLNVVGVVVDRNHSTENLQNTM